MFGIHEERMPFQQLYLLVIHGKKNDKDSNSRESMHEETTNK